MSNPNTPVIVGVSQLLQRVAHPEAGQEVIDMMVDAIRAAVDDTEAANVLKHVDSVRVIRGVWRYKQPAAYIVEKLALGDVETVGTCFGGNMVQSTVNATALEILNGERSLVVLTGAENGHSQAKAKKQGIELQRTETKGAYSRLIGHDETMAAPAEIARGIQMPIQYYPMFENALRFARSESIADHRLRIATLWASFSQVASQNQSAWLQDPVSAETIMTASRQNRMISFPYPKLMNSNSAVDMASAIIMCSVEKAKQLGIPESKWVYPLAGTDAHDHYFVSNRENLHTSPAIRIAGSRALEMLSMNVSDLDRVDVYSCFPSAVQVAVNELGLDDQLPLTVTGGLTFGGGPFNNYVMHSIAKMVELLRQKPGEKGMITANGGFLTKHAFGIYSAVAPDIDFQYQNVQDEVDLTPSRVCVTDYKGNAMIESYTVMYGANGALQAHAACLLDDGRRTWANNADPALMQSMTEAEFCGTAVKLDGAGIFTV